MPDGDDPAKHVRLQRREGPGVEVAARLGGGARAVEPEQREPRHRHRQRERERELGLGRWRRGRPLLPLCCRRRLRCFFFSFFVFCCCCCSFFFVCGGGVGNGRGGGGSGDGSRSSSRDRRLRRRPPDQPHRAHLGQVPAQKSAEVRDGQVVREAQDAELVGVGLLVERGEGRSRGGGGGRCCRRCCRRRRRRRRRRRCLPSGSGGRLGFFPRRNPPVQVHDARDVLHERVPGGEGDLGREVLEGLAVVVGGGVALRVLERRKGIIDRVVDARSRCVHASVSLRHANSDGVHGVLEGERSPPREGEGRVVRPLCETGERTQRETAMVSMIVRERERETFFLLSAFSWLTLKGKENTNSQRHRKEKTKGSTRSTQQTRGSREN